MTIKEAIWHLGTYSSTNGSGQTTQDQHEEAKRMAINALTAQRWIPCSERLPEEDDYKSCIECLDGAVWYFTENGTMGLGYYYKSVKEWSTTDDLKTDRKVVAWMPLPDPWKGEP